MSTRPLRTAILTHSTNPRGGVVHSLELGDALTQLGHTAVVHAPDVKGSGFFRATLCGTRLIATDPVGSDTAAMVEVRADGYVRHFADAAHRRFDVFHAQDGISGNALATLRERGLIRGFARTVHHVDAFRDPRLVALQERSIRSADALFVVSRMWCDYLRDRFDRDATIIGNGVDLARFSPVLDGREEQLRQKLGLRPGLVLLAIGGVEERKNTIAILEAFRQVWQVEQSVQLVIAGGATVLDHHAYRSRFDETLRTLGPAAAAVALPGEIAQADMPALYRIADTLVFPSIKEGFGLVAIEAMASGLPVVTSKIAPFTEHLRGDSVVWCDPLSVTSIADAILISRREPMRSRLIARGYAVAARHDWSNTAQAHLAVYESLREFEHA